MHDDVMCYRIRYSSLILCSLCVCSLSLWAEGCFLPTDRQPDDVSGQFDALTYNVAGLPEGLSSSNPDVNTSQISPRLNSYDLVLVQEDFAYSRELRSQVDLPYQSLNMETFTRAMPDGLNRFGLAPFDIDVDRHIWDVCNGVADSGSDCLADKGFSVAVHTLAEGVELVVVNLHADAGGNPGDVDARQQEYVQLAAFLDQVYPGRALLVVGDTNLDGFDESDEPVLQSFMTSEQLQDACRTLACGEEHIDRFLFRSSEALTLTPVAWNVATEFVDADGNDLSDHAAVHVAWEWTAPAP